MAPSWRRTVYPRLSSSPHRCDAMNPFAPVTQTTRCAADAADAAAIVETEECQECATVSDCEVKSNQRIPRQQKPTKHIIPFCQNTKESLDSTHSWRVVAVTPSKQ